MKVLPRCYKVLSFCALVAFLDIGFTIIHKDFRRNVWVGKTVFHTSSKTPDFAKGWLQVPVLRHTFD